MENFINTAALSDGRTILLEEDDTISISLIFQNKIEDTVPFPCPSGGYGGGSLLLSPSEEYLVFSYFSGESEEAFAVLQIERNRLKLLHQCPYLYGEGAGYRFMNQEKLLVQTLRTGSWYRDEAQVDENGDQYYEFGELNFFDMETGKLDRHTILVYPSDDWTEEETDAGAFFVSDVTDGKLLQVKMPWGNETFRYPLPDTLAVRFK